MLFSGWGQPPCTPLPFVTFHPRRCGQIALVHLKPSLTSAITRLADADIPSPRLTAELLLMSTLDCDRAHLYAHPERVLTPAELTRFDHALAERLRGVPTQYITGHQEFWGMDFLVSPAVLIPRPETEHLIEAVLDCVGQAPSSVPLRIADIGTGSGCIAIALAKELPHAEIHATDISPAALEVARSNASRHHLEYRIRFHQADLLTGLDTNSFDFIVSNPPYIATSEQHSLQPEVRDFEPHTALFAGPSGLSIIQRLIPAALSALKPGGFLVIEIASSLAPPVIGSLSLWDNPLLIHDLQSLPRVVRARKPADLP